MDASTNDSHTDYAVFGRNGQLAVVVEAKNKRQVTSAWAAAWFRNYLADRRTAPPFVVLATPSRVYVWNTVKASSGTPAAETDARRLFSAYLSSSITDPTKLSGAGLELVVGAWLRDLSQQLWQPSDPEDVAALVDTGLLKAVENGRIVTEVAA